jgi:hypothetical protein
MALSNEELVRKAEVIMATEGLESSEKRQWERGVDFVASPSDSEDKVLLRVITDPKSKSGMVGANSVNQAIEVFEDEEFDKGIFISNWFTKSAKAKMREKGIRIVSQNIKPSFTPSSLYLAMQEYIDELCTEKCGAVPKKELECKGFSDGKYSCRVRQINDKVAFHFERGWTQMLQKDFERIIALYSSMTSGKNRVKQETANRGTQR